LFALLTEFRGHAFAPVILRYFSLPTQTALYTRHRQLPCKSPAGRAHKASFADARWASILNWKIHTLQQITVGGIVVQAVQCRIAADPQQQFVMLVVRSFQV